MKKLRQTMLLSVLALFLMIVPGASLAQERATPAATPLLSADALAARLHQGGLIIVMRHQRSAISGYWDDFTHPWSECTAQRNLSTAGHAGASETGQALRILEIPIGTVLASPMCRTMETARLAFGRAQPREELGHITDVRHRTEAMASRDLLGVLRTLMPQADNAVIVTHGGNVLAAFGVLLSEGDMLIFEPSDQQPVLIGRASPADFDLLANARLIEQRTAGSSE